MQYGNGGLTENEINKEISLNRTMQYGNDYVSTYEVTTANGLNRTMQYGNIDLMRAILLQQKFKSYYVVWKQIGEKKYKYIDACLNRTMQYGNHSLQMKKKRNFFRLNRTMQYGNPTCVHSS